MSQNKSIQLGLCCLNSTLREKKPPIFTSRKMIVKTVNEKGIDALKEKITQNLKDLVVLIEWNEQNGIKVFRLSSEMFPHFTNDKTPSYTLDFAEPLLKKAGDLAKKYNHRLTFHPGQYNVIGTPHVEIFEKTVKELCYHADVLNLMGMGKDSVMVIHGGGVYGDKIKTIERWCENYKKLPEKITERLVLENCEKCYSIEDCLEISSKTGIPVVFDTHHFECYNILHPDEKFKKPGEYIENILETWKKKNIKPKFHVSEQGKGRCGHHSDYIEVLPDYLLDIPEKYGMEIDIMIEAKAKEKAILKLYRKYPFLDLKNGTSESL